MPTATVELCAQQLELNYAGCRQAATVEGIPDVGGVLGIPLLLIFHPSILSHLSPFPYIHIHLIILIILSIAHLCN